MLKNLVVDADPVAEKAKIMPVLEDILKDYQDCEVMEDTVYRFEYPVLEYPDKIKSLGFDKTPLIEGTLLGIKGQYLIFDNGVINIRKHGGYRVSLEYEPV